MDFIKLFSLDYWFNTNPGLISAKMLNSILFILLLILGLFLITKILVRLEIKRKKIILSRFYNKWSSLWIFLLIISAFLTFFRYEDIPFLSGRFWFAFLFIGIVFWIGYLIFYYFKRMPRQKIKVAEKKDFDKYLPKKTKISKKKKK